MNKNFEIENFMEFKVRHSVGDDLLFMLSDVCGALSIKNPTMAKKSIFKEYLVEATFDSNGRKIKANAVTEAGLYQLIMRSNKPKAIQFQKFIFEKLLPELRRKQFFEELERKEGTELGKSFARIMATR